MSKAYFGSGCFWCLEAVYQRVSGVESVISGYAGGETLEPTYEQVSTGETGHAEVVEINYDLTKISYPQLLDIFWAVHDPTTLNRQGNDIGTQYRSIILTANDQQLQEAKQSLDITAKQVWGENIVTEILPLTTFYAAEEYHQNYYNKNSENGYCQVVINPKLAKLNENFKQLLKP